MGRIELNMTLQTSTHVYRGPQSSYCLASMNPSNFLKVECADSVNSPLVDLKVIARNNGIPLCLSSDMTNHRAGQLKIGRCIVY